MITLLTTLDEAAPLVQALRATGLIRARITARDEADALVGATILLVNWPHILRQDFIERQQVVLNVHNSLLPRYRGRHAFTWAILHGERELGFSLHIVVPRIDAGDVLAQVAFPLGEDEDVMAAFRRGEEVLLSWLPATLVAWSRGELEARAQDEAAANYFRMRNDEDNWIPSFSRATEVRNIVRAVAPPYTAGAKCRTPDGAVLRVASAAIGATNPAGREPGTVLGRDGDILHIACGDSVLFLRLAGGSAPAAAIGDRLLAGAP